MYATADIHSPKAIECVDSQVAEATDESEPRRWKIIIADDEEEVHRMTRMVLSDYSFDGRELEFLNAHSGEETLQLLSLHPDTAVILLDVVMESDDAGLRIIHHIRRNMANPYVRIVLRTGQPGKAPETQIISEYDINDYKEKTELTAQKLYTTITSSLRTYRDMKIIDQNRRGLEKIIDASADLFESQSLGKFAQGVLIQLTSLFQLDESTALFMGSAFTAEQRENDFLIIAGTGKYEGCVGKFLHEAVPGEVLGYLTEAITGRKSIFKDDMYAGYFATRSSAGHLLYLKRCRHLTEMDKNLLTIFSTNVAIAFDNIALNQEMIDTQKEVIFTLGEVIESRSRETGNHVRRVAEMSYLLALKAGLSEKEAELLRLASPMHDVGKVGIPDAILLKNDSLTQEEREIIQQHTEIGHHILKNSQRELLQASVIVAYQHHEHWDGNGYPHGLKGEQIHIFGRITALIDVFDALLHKRVYKAAWPVGQILEHIRLKRGTQFEPNLVDIFLANRDEFINIKSRYPD
jgi:response regulator RpfG family c-di-GMP phosphodiesterase